MATRGVILTYEAVRYWCRTFGQAYPYNVSYPGTSCMRFFLCDRKARWLRRWMPATDRSTSAIVKVFKGKTTTSRLLSWDTVIAGAFFPQAYVQMPEEKVG
jgi:hypothetical protein